MDLFLGSQFLGGQRLSSNESSEFFLAVDRENGQRRAVKIACASQCGARRLENEIYILQRIQHPNLVKLLRVYVENMFWYVVLEYVDGRNLCDDVVACGPCSEAQFLAIGHQLHCALDYLHACRLAHRDIKPDNVILEGDSRLTASVKLCDFGWTTRASLCSGCVTLCGTPDYMAPEIFSVKRGNVCQYGYAVDWWSFGVLMYVCFFVHFPFTEENLEEDISSARYEITPEEDELLSDRAGHILSHMLSTNPQTRYLQGRTLLFSWENK